MNRIIEQRERIYDLLLTVDDDLVRRYFDLDSDKLLEDKIEVLTALSKGVNIADIPKYYKVLELLPTDRMWD